jgi:hypothetical protein
LAAREAAFLCEQHSVDFFVFEYEGYEHGLARTVLVSRQACQTVTPVDKFFNSELQEMILTARNAEGGT